MLLLMATFAFLTNFGTASYADANDNREQDKKHSASGG